MQTKARNLLVLTILWALAYAVLLSTQPTIACNSEAYEVEVHDAGEIDPEGV